MTYFNTAELTLKVKTAIVEGPNEFIRQAIRNIPNGNSVRMVDIADDVLKAYDSSLSGKDKKEKKMRVYIRIGDQFKKLAKKDSKLFKFEDGNGYTHIGRPELTPVEKEAAEFGLDVVWN
jgi:hypothetical protein